MIKIAVIGIVAVLLAIQLKNYKPEYSTYISLSACILIFTLGFHKLEVIIQTMQKIQSYIPINGSYITILIKMVGITYIAEISSDLCKDAGHAAISNQIELIGKLTILSISMPVILSLLDTIDAFLQ